MVADSASPMLTAVPDRTLRNRDLADSKTRCAVETVRVQLPGPAARAWFSVVRCCRTIARFLAGHVPVHGTPERSRTAREDDLVNVQRDPGIGWKRQPAAQPGTLGRTDIEPIADDYAGLRIHMTKMLQ